MQIPSNMLITRIKPGIYMSSWMLVWAVVSACTALVQSFGGIVAARFFLGITEAPVSQFAASVTFASADERLVLSRCDLHAFHLLHP